MLDLPDHLPWVVLDTETSGLHPDDGARVACLALTWPDPFDWEMVRGGENRKVELVTRAFPFDQGVRDKLPTVQLDLFGGEEDPNLPLEAWQELCAWLTRQQLLIYHNAKFDITLMNAGTREWEGVDLREVPFWCTQIAQRELDPKEQVGLDVTCRRLGIGGKEGLDALKDWLRDFGKRNGIAWEEMKSHYDYAPWHVIEPYVTGDTWNTAELYMYQDARLANGETEVREFIDREIEMCWALLRMEWRGIGYDAGESLRAASVLERYAQDLEATMPFKVKPDAMKKWFCDEQGLKTARVSDKTQKPTLDEEQLRDWAADGVEWAQEATNVSRARRAVSMWYRGYPEKMGLDGRLRTVYRQTHVKSGRMSVERVQLQAIPKKRKEDPVLSQVPHVRDLIRPKEGNGLWSLDLSQAELRVASHYSGCERMLEMLLQGVDAHGETCKEVINVYPDDPDWKRSRDIAKRITFGGIFQIGPDKFQRTLAQLADVHWPIEKCRQTVWRWRAMYPEFGDYYRLAERSATSKGYVRLLPNTPYEKLSYFGYRDWHHTAWNRIVQGSLAEAFKLLTVGVEKRWPGFLVLTVHDSTVLDAPLDEGAQVAEEVAAWGGAMMTELFGVEMKMDIDRWDQAELGVAA